MEFEWDDNKNQRNMHKHGIDFDDAKNVFLDPYRIEYLDNREDYGEIRFKVIGMTEGCMLAVICTTRESNIRIISARRARKDERRAYCESQT